MPPLVVIAIPTRNRAGLLPETIDSLLAQDYPNFRIVISDNASDDETPAVCRDYAARDSRLTFHRNPQNIGLVGNFNRAIELTEGGKYAVIAGDDDLYDRMFLSRLIEVLDRNPSAVLAACSVEVIDQDGHFAWSVDQKYATDSEPSAVRRAKRMLWSGYGNLMTGVYQREMLGKSPWFRHPYAQYWDFIDTTFLFGLAVTGDVLWIPDVLLHKRAGGVSGQAVYRSFAATVRTIAGGIADYFRRAPGLSLRLSLVPFTIVVVWRYRSELVKSLLVGWLSAERRMRLGKMVRGQ